MKEFQEQFEISEDGIELSSLPPAAVIDMYIKDVHRRVSELDDTNTNFHEIDDSNVDHESLATTALALQMENDSLRQRIDQVQSEKKDLEKQLVSVEEMITLARELKDENQGLIRDFKGLKDCIVVEQEVDAVEIVELTKSFKELIAENETLRRENEERQIELATGDMHLFTSSIEGQELKDTMVDCGQVLDKFVSSVVVAKSSQATSDQNVQTEEPQVEMDYQMAKLWKKNTLDSDGETQTEAADVEVQTTGVYEVNTLEDREACSVVAELMTDVRRKNDEINRLHQNLERMDRVLGEMTKTNSATDAVTEDSCLFTDHQEMVVSQHTARSVGVVRSMETNVDSDFPDAERNRCNKETTNTKTEEFPLPECETVSAAKWMSRQASTDSGVSRSRSFERSRDRDHNSSLGDSGLQSQPAETELVGLSSAWEQLVAENHYLRRELAKLTAAPASKRTPGEDQHADVDSEDSGKTVPLQHHTAQLESEIAALKRTVKEQSVYLVSPGVHPDDRGNELSWAHPYDYSGPVTDVDGNDLHKQENDKDDDKGTVEVLRCQNVLLEEKLKAMTLKWNEYEASVDRMNDQLEEETARLRDQQSTLLDELASKTKQIEDFKELSRHQTTALQRTVEEITDSYWSVLDEVDSRRKRLNNSGDFDSRNLNEEKTIQVFARRLEGWLKDYQALIRQRNVQRLNGDIVTLCSIPEDQLFENTENAEMGYCEPDYQNLLTDVNSHLESVDREIAEMKIPLEHTQLTVDAFVTSLEQLGGELKEKEEWELKANNEEADRLRMKTDRERTQLTVDTLSEQLDRLKAELKAKEEDIKRKNEEIDQIRIENEALQVAASSPSALVASDYEEQLVSEIERLSFDRSSLQQRLQEAEYEIEETREELTSENDQLRRQLDALRQRVEDDKASAVKNAELLVAENRQLCEQLSQRDVDFRSAEESHCAQQAESAERLRAMEEKVMVENGRLHSELIVVTAERSQLRENCAKLENDCLAFQELSNEMIEHCKRLSIELERLRRSGSCSGNVSTTPHACHEDCRRTVEQAHREVQTLKDENSRLALALETEMRKKIAEERPTTIENQTDTADLELSGVLLSASSVDGEGQRLQRRFDVHIRGEGDDGTGEIEDMSLLLGHARAARVTAVQLRRLLNAECPQIDRKAEISSAVLDDGQVTDDAVTKYQLAGIVDKLVVELDALAKSSATTDTEEKVTSLSDGRRNGNNFIDSASADHSQVLELQQLLQVMCCKYFSTLNSALLFSYSQ